MSDAERAVEETKHKWEVMTASIAAETKSFHEMTSADFGRGLCEHVEQQIAFEDQKQKIWRELLAEFKKVDAPPPKAYKLYTRTSYNPTVESVSVD